MDLIAVMTNISLLAVVGALTTIGSDASTSCNGRNGCNGHINSDGHNVSRVFLEMLSHLKTRLISGSFNYTSTTIPISAIPIL